MLCIPTFSFNLIFISKLTQSATCCCIFLSHYCFIQDLQPWRMIRLGKKQGGLYTLQSTSHATLPKPVQDIISNLSSLSLVGSVNTCTAAHAMDNASLWHCKLRHPSAQRLALLHSIVSGIVSYNNNKIFYCSVCPLAKQKRLPFQSSTHSSSSCFDLVHGLYMGSLFHPFFKWFKVFSYNCR